MLNSIVNVQTEVLKILTNNGTSSYLIPGATPLTLPVYYARKSQLTNVENENEKYPLISILDYLPEFDDNWNQNFQERTDGFHDFSGTNGTPVKAYVYGEPVLLLFKYDFTTYVKSPTDRFLVDDFFLRKFGKKGRFVLNKVSLIDGDEGDFVTYNVLRTENGRSDGIFEVNYEISFSTMVNIIDEQEVSLITNFGLGINPTNL